MNALRARAASIALALLPACGNHAERDRADDAPPARATVTAAPKPSVNPADPGPAEANPAAVQPDAPRYSMAGITPIADTCANAKVLVTSSPATPSPKWTFIRATLAAHRELKVDVQGPNGVTFQTAPTSDDRSVQLVASCHDGATCNRLAATYKAVVPSSRPQVFCGDVPGVRGLRHVTLDATIPTAGDDAIEKCARLGVCIRAQDPTGIGDPGLDCQKAPSHFKLACASKPSCADVVACAR